ncbi:hypothetical protein VR7878_02682 [Vibrio ruber DSM 16370]|uniref:Uncharacterized protein n=1 Tax=Vibrio ruber (strain DSM 16370 / JCM 11486 / BCRC 17186 / CECT 7878 / LMG 23124 / VR1) TaxID=1123498 RepID=A0A1R4LP92_VIBR1|nr:hypothetical protein [Vibrio ruber]SJN58157.1 hypothetical protein VR7878_02682 [Vibrio ruber DSM 16370]
MKAQQAFDRLVSRDFNEALSEDVKSVALAVWHENFVPDISQLDSNSARSASYLLDRLMRYNCVTPEEQKKLLNVVALLSRKFGLETATVVSLDHRVDKYARKWGLKSDLKLMLRAMLPYQTRHYR